MRGGKYIMDRAFWALVALIVLGGFGLTWTFVEPAPPSRVVLTTGSPEGVYFALGQRYQTLLAREGIEVEVLSSGGSVENLQRLRDGQAELALVQSGIAQEGDDELLHALGSLYLEPLWIFTRGESSLQSLTQLHAKPVSLGAEGSGTQALASMLLEEAEVEVRATMLGSRDSASALLSGEIEAAFMVTSPSSPVVQQLLRAPGVQLLDLRRAEAFSMHLRFLEVLTLVEGSVDLSENLPPEETRMLAATANLVARNDLHPALNALLLEVAQEIHHEGGLLEPVGSYPSPDHVDLPLSQDAAWHYEHGPSFLNRFLPFWAASLVDRLKILLLPLLTLLIPLLRVAPPVYRWRIRSRIYHWYGSLHRLHLELYRPDSDRAALLASLETLEREADHVEVPLSYMEEYYSLRTHMALVRSRLEERSFLSGEVPRPASKEDGRT